MAVAIVLSDEQLERYGRQILVQDFDVEGQERLAQSCVLILGQGGLGNPAALYLAAAGIGRLILADGDTVELSNLQRQIAHNNASIGQNKAVSAAATVGALNPTTVLQVVPELLDASNMSRSVESADLVIDATDNYPSRFALNRACIAAGVPLVSGAAVRSEGQVAVFDPHRGGPCYRCLYPSEGADTALSCSESGVLAPLVGVIGSLQAMEAVKILAGYGESLRGKLLAIDLATMDFRRLQLAPRAGCPDCAHLQG